jgi:3-deoxy-D-manno-octulosonate 8-phosphate phosphatase (KDO 8-P phosphatase)
MSGNEKRKQDVEYLVIDVDGTMTDAGVYYDEFGNELKKFCTKDAAGFYVAKKVGIKTIVLTGRECKATSRRMKELSVDYLYQGVRDKSSFLELFFEEHKIERTRVAYIGDDLNDLQPMSMAGYICCPADSCDEVKIIADYISPIKGGYGVITDVVRHILNGTNKWSDAIRDVYCAGI